MKPLILNLYKPVGMTSFQVIKKLKKHLPRKTKIGHMGTLDPFAHGVLLVAIGQSTRLMNFVHLWLPKTYEALGRFGELRDTADVEGQVIQRAQLPTATIEDAQEVLESFIGEYYQNPPFFSATKHQGKKLYELAREGKFIEKEKILRKIYELDLLSLSEEELEFKACVSTGTYIRVLFEDIAKKLQTVGHLRELKRTQIGKFSIEDSVSLDEIDSLEDIIKKSLIVSELFDLEKVYLNQVNSKYYINGQRLKNVGTENVHAWVMGENDQCLGLAKREEQVLIPKVNFSH